MSGQLRTGRGQLPTDGSRDLGSNEGQQPLASMASVVMEQKEAKFLLFPPRQFLWLRIGWEHPQPSPAGTHGHCRQGLHRKS